MKEEFIKLTGEKEGPTSIILAGVHGDENCGIKAFEKLLPNLQIEKGQVLFGYGNPRAISENRRFTEANLNRMFKDDDKLSEEDKHSYEYGRAQFLKKYLNQTDALLDIHASFTANSKPFIICEENAKEVAKYLPVNLIVSGFDKIEPGGTDYFMNSIGKIGICVECGYLGSSQSAQIAEKSIFAFLKARKHITNNIKPQKKSYIQMYNLYITKTSKFTLSKPFGDFEEIKKNQIIGIDGDEKIRADKAGIILFARNLEQVGDEAFLLGENKNSLV